MAVATQDGDRYVGRGGVKLRAALDAFDVAVEGVAALDVGASTGGFTDCLLQAGAAHVVATDVGYGQLAWALRTDSRVTVVDRTNFRHADVEALGAPFDLVVADVSFISLTVLVPQFDAALAPAGNLVVLVKPQFEVGRERVGKGGIVREPAAHASAIASVADAFERSGLGARDVVASPVTGAKGNREFLLWLHRGERLLTAQRIEEVTLP